MTCSKCGSETRWVDFESKKGNRVCGNKCSVRGCSNLDFQKCPPRQVEEKTIQVEDLTGEKDFQQEVKETLGLETIITLLKEIKEGVAELLKKNLESSEEEKQSIR